MSGSTLEAARHYLEKLWGPAPPVPPDAYDVEAVRWKMREELEQAAFAAFRTAVDSDHPETRQAGIEGILILAGATHSDRFSGDGMNPIERYLNSLKGNAALAKPIADATAAVRQRAAAENRLREEARPKARLSDEDREHVRKDIELRRELLAKGEPFTQHPKRKGKLS